MKLAKVTQGRLYSTIAWISDEQGSWALPLRHERISSLNQVEKI
jgi:hypothetical protein